MIKKCNWIKFCDDTDARKPLIVEKSLIDRAACPGIGTNMTAITIGKVERSRKDKCEDCPYCSNRVSFSKSIQRKAIFKYLPCVLLFPSIVMILSGNTLNLVV